MEVEMIISYLTTKRVSSTDHEIRIAKMTRVKDPLYTYVVHFSFPTKSPLPNGK